MISEKRTTAEQLCAIISDAIYAEIANAEKNMYDPEVNLPPIGKVEGTLLKKEYNSMSLRQDAAHKKRREKRPGVLEELLKNGNTEAATKMIRKEYYVSFAQIEQQIRCCNEKTTRKILTYILGFFNCDFIKKQMPTALLDEIEACIAMWLPYTRTLCKCSQNKISPLDTSEKEMICIYNTYILLKKIILINSNCKSEYEEKIAFLHYNKKLNAVIAAIREIRKGE